MVRAAMSRAARPVETRQNQRYLQLGAQFAAVMLAGALLFAIVDGILVVLLALAASITAYVLIWRSARQKMHLSVFEIIGVFVAVRVLVWVVLFLVALPFWLL